MRKGTLIICLYFLHCGMMAQVPGYMGLKFSLQYQGSISPQWNNFGQSWLPYYSHNIQAGYVVSRRYEVGLQYTRTDYGSGFYRTAYIGDYQNNSVQQLDYRHFTGNNVTAYIKLFRDRKGFIAPLGRYFLLGLSYEYSHDRFHVSPSSSSIPDPPFYADVISQDIALTAGVGRNFILFDRMILSIEGDVNIPLTALGRLAANPAPFYGTNSPDNLYKHNNAADVILVNIVQIKIGLGPLIF